MSSTPTGSGLFLPGKSGDERTQHRLAAIENVSQESWRGFTNWVNLSYLDSTATVGGSLAAAYMRTGDGLVMCRGYVTMQFGTARVGTLPAGFRPGAGVRRFPAGGTGASGDWHWDVETDGDIVAYGSSFPANLDLSSIIFLQNS